MLPEFILCCITLWCEARGEPLAGKMLVASTFVNRAEIRKTTIQKQLLRPYQYSCWNGEFQRQKIQSQYNAGAMNGPAWEECKKVIRMLYDGTLPKTQLTHYYNPKLVKKGSPAWEWIKELKNKKKVGNHIYGTCK